MKRIALILCLAAVAAAPAGAALAQADPLTQELDARSDRRLDRMEKTVREMRAIIFQGRDTGKAVVVMPADTEALLGALTNRVADLEETLRRMNGQIETLSRDLDLARAEAKTSGEALAALNARVGALEGQVGDFGAAAVPGEAQAGASAAPDTQAAEAAAAFTRARRLLLDGQYPAASAAFQGYVETYGDTPKAAEARYWLGETQFVQGRHAEAATAYIGAVRGWPATPWAADATAKLSLSLIEIGKSADACRTLAELGRRYPKASPAVKARAADARTRAGCAA